MSKRNVVHGTFTVERRYPVAPAAVFRAFSDQTIKDRWFAVPPGWVRTERMMDFRVGGKETSIGGPKGGEVHAFRATYLNIVPGERIIYAYDMDLDGVPISASLAVIEMLADGQGTRLKVTEHGAFLDGYDDAGAREQGTNFLLDQLDQVLMEKAA